MAFPTPRWLSTHRRQLHLLLSGGRCWFWMLATPAAGRRAARHSLYPAGRVFYLYTPNFRYRTDDCSRVSCVGWQRIPTGRQELLPRNAAPSSLDRIADNVKLVGGETIGFMILGHYSHAKSPTGSGRTEKHSSRSEWACVAAGLQRGQQVRRT